MSKGHIIQKRFMEISFNLGEAFLQRKISKYALNNRLPTNSTLV
jgi:hypothetical protein